MPSKEYRNTHTESEAQEEIPVSIYESWLTDKCWWFARKLYNTVHNFIFYSVYRGDRRGQDIESSNSIPSRHPHHRNYPLPLPPTQAVVTNSLRNRNRYNRKKQPVRNFTTSILIDNNDNGLLPKMLKWQNDFLGI